MTRKHFYLFLTDHSLNVWQGPAGRLHEHAVFAADSDGVDAFAAFAAAQVDAHWHVLLDLQEEDCRIETIPHVGPIDRQRLIRRKQEQLYRATRYRSASPQGRESEGRRDDRILFTAVANPGPIDLWLDHLLTQQARIVGIQSITLLTARHARKLRQIPPRALIVSRQQGSGLRQVYMADGNLRFSRLTALDDTATTALAQQLATEAARARQFLASLRAVERDEALQVVMLCSADEQIALRAACPDTELIHYHFLPLQELGKALGVSNAGSAPTAEAIWLGYLARHQPANQYATLTQRKPYLAWRAGLMLYGVSAALLMGAAALGWHYQQETQRLEQDSASLLRAKAAAEQVYAQNVTEGHSGDFTPGGMKNIVQSYRTLVQQWPGFATSLIDISRITRNYPMLELDTLEWQVGTLADTQQATTGATAAPEDNAASGRWLVLQVAGHLSGYQDRYREALQQIDLLGKDFARWPGARATATQLPIDTRPDKQIALDSRQGEGSAGAPFALRISLPLAATSEVQP